MQVYVVYAHPSERSFTRQVLDAFQTGLRDAGHKAETGDLYAMGFQSDMDLDQYQREVGDDPNAEVPADVQREQGKIARADAVVFVYPVWWSDCPAKLKGWFDRVLTHGYAYWRDGSDHHQKSAKVDKVLVICPAGHTEAHLEQTGIAESMRKIMLNDRVPGLNPNESSMEILGGMTNDDGTQRQRNLRRAYELGRSFMPSRRGANHPTSDGCC